MSQETSNCLIISKQLLLLKLNYLISGTKHRSKCLISSLLQILHFFKAKYSLLSTKKAILATGRLCFYRVWKATTNIAWPDRASPHSTSRLNSQGILSEAFLATCFLQWWVEFWFLFSLLTPLSTVDKVVVCFLVNVCCSFNRISKEPVHFPFRVSDILEVLSLYPICSQFWAIWWKFFL